MTRMREAIRQTLWYQTLQRAGRADEFSEPGVDILTCLPRIPEAYESDADAAADVVFEKIAMALGCEGDDEKVIVAFTEQHEQDKYEEWPPDPDRFGHLAVMTMAGEGVGLWEYVTSTSWKESPLRSVLDEALLESLMLDAAVEVPEAGAVDDLADHLFYFTILRGDNHD